MKTYKGNTSYTMFIRKIGLTDEKTPDNIKWLSSYLDYKALNEMMRENV